MGSDGQPGGEPGARAGGPVVDAGDGRLVGIVFGFRDGALRERLMYAYGMRLVFAELAAARGATHPGEH